MKTQSLLSYFGSDSESAPDLASMLNHCSHVTIAMVGGASIIPYLTARAIVANDLNDYAINFYQCLRGVHGERTKLDLIECCQHTLSHPATLRQANAKLQSEVALDRAWAYWAICWVGRKGKGGTRGEVKMPSVRWNANGGTNATRIKTAADDLYEWADHVERCEWLCECYSTLIPKVSNHPDCGLYIDAPWIGAGDAYLHSFTEADHRKLRTLVERFDQTTVVIRYGDDPSIRELYSDWIIVDATSRDQANQVKPEIWIHNDVLIDS